MDKVDFLNQLLKCSKMATEFAREFVVDKLPNGFLYDVEILVKPGSLGNPIFKGGLDESSVCTLLCREGKVPEWIDIYVARRKGRCTVLKLDCSWRFENSPSKLYYTWDNTAPFGVKSPVLPSGWSPSCGKFRLCPTVLTCLLDIVMLRWRTYRHTIGDRNSVCVQFARGEGSVRAC